MEAYRYIDILVNAILAVFNLLSRIQSSLRIGLKKVLKRNVSLKNLRSYDECYIIGNGPSLNDVDLSKLEGKDTFCVNFFYKCPKNHFQSKFFLVVDNGFSHNEVGRDYIRKVYNDYPEMIMLLRYDFIYEKRIKWNLNRTFFLYSKQFQYGDVVKWDCTKNMTACINVILQCIQVAMYMGYKKIYLLGCDFNQYAQLKPGHFYGDQENDWRSINGISMGSDARWSSMVHFHHYALQKEASKRGISIVNLTENSLIDAYPKARFEDIR